MKVVLHCSRVRCLYEVTGLAGQLELPIVCPVFLVVRCGKKFVHGFS